MIQTDSILITYLEIRNALCKFFRPELTTIPIRRNSLMFYNTGNALLRWKIRVFSQVNPTEKLYDLLVLSLILIPESDALTTDKHLRVYFV